MPLLIRPKPFGLPMTPTMATIKTMIVNPYPHLPANFADAKRANRIPRWLRGSGTTSFAFLNSPMASSIVSSCPNSV
ncbi:MAG: hypothetical protein ACO2PL_09405 [Armatimonadota bacterium]